MLGRGLKIEKNISRKESSGKRSAITPGLIPARKGAFLFGEKYSLDRGPLMGTSLQSEMTLRANDYW